MHFYVVCSKIGKEKKEKGNHGLPKNQSAPEVYKKETVSFGDRFYHDYILHRSFAGAGGPLAKSQQKFDRIF